MLRRRLDEVDFKLPPNTAMKEYDKPMVLCVEDNEDECELVKEILSAYEVICVATINAACSLLETVRFALVIVDEHLTDGSGMRLCKQITRKNRNASVILISGDPYITSAEAQEAGAKAFLKKSSETYNEDLYRFANRLALSANA